MHIVKLMLKIHKNRHFLYHMSHITRCLSPVTCHMSLMPTATATDSPAANSPTIHKWLVCKDQKNSECQKSSILTEKNIFQFCNIIYMVKRIRMDIMQNSVTFFLQLRSLNTCAHVLDLEQFKVSGRLVFFAHSLQTKNAIHFFPLLIGSVFNWCIWALNWKKKSDTILHNIHPCPFDPHG